MKIYMFTVKLQFAVHSILGQTGRKQAAPLVGPSSKGCDGNDQYLKVHVQPTAKVKDITQNTDRQINKSDLVLH